MAKGLRRMADEAEANGALSEYLDYLREQAQTYAKRASSARHPGGRRIE